MTRYTNVALKRSYVEAGFNYREPDGHSEEAGPSNVNHAEVNNNNPDAKDHTVASEPKRKRSRKGGKKSSDMDGETMPQGGSGGQDGDAGGEKGSEPGDTKQPASASNGKAAKGKNKLKQKTLKGKDARKAASEKRRLQRRDERSVNTTCYACREMGHAARNCPKAIAADALGSEDVQQKLGKQAVGICYRCGSRKHNLSRCKKPVDPGNPLPFSSCFVCSKQGHLASSCPENRSKGVYPNGGCCKLCGETTHLAKDCKLRKPEVASTLSFIGIGSGAGADEDDFHTFKRKNLEINKEEKDNERWKKQQLIKVAAHSGVVKAFGRPTQTPRKVVQF